jgi:glucans biosynthesis protein
VTDFSRRTTVAALLAAALAKPGLTAAASWPTGAALGAPQPFSFDRLKASAAALARRPYRPPVGPPADLVHAIDYDAFGRIVYRPDATLWGDAPGGRGVRFFPLGRPANVAVAVSVVSGGQARPVLYAEKLFDTPADSPARALGDKGGFAGFKVLNADRKTDWIAYLGASYFRSADPFNQYGLSARLMAMRSIRCMPGIAAMVRSIRLRIATPRPDFGAMKPPTPSAPFWHWRA